MMIWFLAFLCRGAWGLPPEGMELYGIIGKSNIAITGFASVHDPIWRNPYNGIGAYGTVSIGEEYLSFGGKTTTFPTLGDRNAYFMRFDWMVGATQSIGFKYIHEEWRYISTGKESVGIDYNLFLPFSESRSGFYVTFGGYYRWLKQRWNRAWWQPFDFETSDQEGLFQSVIGFASSLGSGGHYWTIDMNIRDTYSYYHADNVAFETSLNFEVGTSTLVRLWAGVRTAALFMGTGSVSENFAGLSLTFF